MSFNFIEVDLGASYTQLLALSQVHVEGRPESASIGCSRRN